MNNTRQETTVSLGVQLGIALVVSLLLALGSFFVIQSVGDSMIAHVLEDPDAVDSQTQYLVSQFQDYISDQELATSDTQQLDDWVKRKQRYVSMAIYVDGVPVYDSDYPDLAQEFGETAIAENTAAYSWQPLYTVEFADASAQISLNSYYDYFYYSLLNYLALALSFFIFLMVFLTFVRKKTSYINRLAKEIQILESGELEYPITIRGRDELTELGRGIDAMRLSVIERLQSEEAAHRANSELITSMSHDLRTPLTALMGYLEIIEQHKYQTPEQLFEYIHKSRQKAYQLKGLSDRLFEYFLVYGREQDAVPLERYPGNELLAQLIGDSVFDLQDQRFTVNTNPIEAPFTIATNVEYLRRVFNNLFSNLLKYAERTQPVEILYTPGEREITITFSNTVRQDGEPVESTGLGLKTCERILKQLDGSFSSGSENGKFTASLTLPVKWEEPR